MFSGPHKASHQKGDALAIGLISLFDGEFTASEIHRLLHDIEMFAIYDPTWKRHLDARYDQPLGKTQETAKLFPCGPPSSLTVAKKFHLGAAQDPPAAAVGADVDECAGFECRRRRAPWRVDHQFLAAADFHE